MNPAVATLLIYVVVAMCFQFVGFVISRGVDYFAPAFSLITFLMLFLGSMYLAWPVAVFIAERLIPGARPDAPANRA